MSKKLKESGAFTEAKVDNGVIPIRIITEGKGSSGVYSRALLETAAEQGIFDNTPSFMNHPADPSKPWERDVEKIAGRVVGKTHFREENGVAGIYGDYRPSEKYVNWFKENADIVGLSIMIGGDGQEDENGEYIVESFDGSDPYKSVDVVVAAGRGGRFERAMESYRALEESDTAPAAVEHERNEKAMDEAKFIALLEAFEARIAEKFTAIEAKVDSVVTLAESANEAEASKVDALDVADALAEAKLSKGARTRVLESVKAGKSVEDAIQIEADLRKEYVDEAESDGGHVITENADGKPVGLVERWSA